MSKPDRDQLGERLSAYIDGELDAEQTQRIERVLRRDERARRMLEELRRTVDLVSSLPRHVAPDSIAEDVQFHTERSELLGGSRRPLAPTGMRRSPVLAVLSMAAVLALVAIGLPIMISHERDDAGATKVALAPVSEPKGRLAPAPYADAEEAAKEPGVGSAKLGKGPGSPAGDRGAHPKAERLEESRVSAAGTRPDMRHALLDTADLDHKLRAGMDFPVKMD